MFVQLEHVQTNQAPGKVADLFIKIILISFMCNDLFAISLKLFHILTFTQIKIKHHYQSNLLTNNSYLY